MLLHYLGKLDQAKCVEIKNLKKNIPDIIDRYFKKNQQILIIFNKNISYLTGY